MFGDRLWRCLLILIPSLSHFSFFNLAEFILYITLIHPVSPMLLSPLTSSHIVRSLALDPFMEDLSKLPCLSLFIH